MTKLVSSVALVTLASMGLLACTASSEPGGACEHVAGITPPAAGAKGKLLNGSQLNGSQLNGSQLNGAQLNGAQLNGAQVNGAQMNGRTVNGVRLNGVHLNGQQVHGTVAHLDGSRVVLESGGDLPIGATLSAELSDGSTIDLDVADAEAQASDPTIVSYRLTFAGENLCASGKGVFVQGIWDEATGARRDHEGLVTYACTDGAIGKCVLFGYKPWTVGVELHQSCTRMVRADYCGDGISHTRDGTEIDVFDVTGVQSPSDATMIFEAGWGVDGAVCVHAPRYVDVIEGQGVARPTCWSGKPTCESWGVAQAMGARLGDASRSQTRLVCADL